MLDGPDQNQHSGTRAVDLMLAMFEQLEPVERTELLQRLTVAQEVHEAGTESDTQRMLRSLELVGQAAGRTPPKITDYRMYGPELVAAGEDIVPFTELYKHFDGSWLRVEQAMGLAATTSPRKIEARFLHRRTGKVWRYSERQLGETLEACSEYFVRKFALPAGERYAPLISEFDHWRERELELARARGDYSHHLPSASPYRRRWDNWESALVHFGFTPDQLAERLARIPDPQPPIPAETPTPDGLHVAELQASAPDGVDSAHADAIRNIYENLPVRTRHILTMRLGLGARRLLLKEISSDLALHETSVHKIEQRAVRLLQEAHPVHRGRADRELVAHVLRQLTV